MMPEFCHFGYVFGVNSAIFRTLLREPTRQIEKPPIVLIHSPKSFLKLAADIQTMKLIISCGKTKLYSLMATLHYDLEALQKL